MTTTGQMEMQPAPQQQVVVMQPMGGQTNQMQTNQVQQVVVVQQQQPQTGGTTGTVAPEEGNRFPRWGYLFFGIAMWAYHFSYFWMFFILSFLPGGYGVLFFFCGAVPALITFCWLIADSTVFCANPGTGPVTKMCCCSCINGYMMAVPIAIAAVLRVILWASMFGILADFINDFDDGATVLDNVFWMTLSLAAFDVGPLICLAVDWWFYYGKFDFNGLFGHKLNPIRCATGQSMVIFVISWSFIAMFEELDGAQFIWPWILHGIVATATLVFAAFLQFSGSIKGANVSNALFKYIAWLLALATGVMFLIIWGYLFSWIFDPILFLFTGLWIGYGVYYTGMILPTIWALFSIRSGDMDADQVESPSASAV